MLFMRWEKLDNKRLRIGGRRWLIRLLEYQFLLRLQAQNTDVRDPEQEMAWRTWKRKLQKQEHDFDI